MFYDLISGLNYRLLGILGYNKASKALYGVSTNRKVYIRCEENGDCKTIVPLIWRQARDLDTTLLATEIPMIPETGLALTDEPRDALVSSDMGGNQWGGTCIDTAVLREHELS